MSALGDMVRTARRRHRMTMRELGAIVGCAENTIHRIETRDELPLCEAKARVLAGALGLDAVEVLCAGGKPPVLAIAALCDRPDLVRHLVAEAWR